MYRPNDKIGPYTLVKRLGQGASGIVWLAERRGALLTTQVALKLPFDEEANLDTITKEAQVWLAATGHPNVLPVIEADMYDGQVVIVSEYANGGTLKEWLDRNGGMAPSVEDAVIMVAGILAGLDHLHTKGLVHCDLKPSNVLLQGDIPRITDFGVSRVLRATVHTKHLSGTPAYMPPEAIDGKLSKYSDLWAAGVILYVMLAGRLPFPQQSMGPLMLAIQHQDPDQLPASVPAEIQRVIAQSLEKDPVKRYPSALGMRSALNAAPTKNPYSTTYMALPEKNFATTPITPIAPLAPATLDEPIPHHSMPLEKGVIAIAEEIPLSGEVRINPKDGAEVVWIPAGDFFMGSDRGERREQPVHRVFLDGYWMYKRPVTVAQYRTFCAETNRQLRHAPGWGWQDDHPIVNVSWDYALAYCHWAGAQLPTEAEWEKSARGFEEREYPWGAQWDGGNCRNSVGLRQHGTAQVGFYSQAGSPYGVQDLAGNVWEWTNDWYEESYYMFTPDKNPTGPVFGIHRVLRGGSWGNDTIHDFRTTTRVVCEPVVRGGSIGFRCVIRTISGPQKA